MMNIRAEGLETLSRVCREIDALGEHPDMKAFHFQALDEKNMHMLIDIELSPINNFFRLTTYEEDPLSRPSKKRLWHSIPALSGTTIKRVRETEEFRKLIGAPEPKEPYWRYLLASRLKEALSEHEENLSSLTYAQEFVFKYGPSPDYEQAQKKVGSSPNRVGSLA